MKSHRYLVSWLRGCPQERPSRGGSGQVLALPEPQKLHSDLIVTTIPMIRCYCFTNLCLANKNSRYVHFWAESSRSFLSEGRQPLPSLCTSRSPGSHSHIPYPLPHSHQFSFWIPEFLMNTDVHMWLHNHSKFLSTDTPVGIHQIRGESRSEDSSTLQTKTITQNAQ